MNQKRRGCAAQGAQGWTARKTRLRRDATREGHMMQGHIWMSYSIMYSNMYSSTMQCDGLLMLFIYWCISGCYIHITSELVQTPNRMTLSCQRGPTHGSSRHKFSQARQNFALHLSQNVDALPRVSNAAATPPKLRSLNGRVHELDSRNLGSPLANSRNLGSPLANLVPGILRVVGADGIHERTGVKATSRMPVMM